MKFKQSSVRTGTRIESEHRDVTSWIRKYAKQHGKIPKNSLIFRHIAETHLKEDPAYYKKLKKMERKK